MNMNHVQYGIVARGLYSHKIHLLHHWYVHTVVYKNLCSCLISFYVLRFTSLFQEVRFFLKLEREISLP